MPTLSFRKYKPIAEATYLFKIDSVGEQKGKWGPTLTWKCVIASEGEEQDNFINYLTSAEFGPKSKTYKFLMALGVDADALIEDADFDTSSLVGSEFYGAVVTKDDGSGKQYSNITDIWSVEAMEKLMKNIVKTKTLNIPVNQQPVVSQEQEIEQTQVNRIGTITANAPVNLPAQEVAQEEVIANTVPNAGVPLKVNPLLTKKQEEFTPSATPIKSKITPLRKTNPGTGTNPVAGDLTFPKA